MSDYNTKSHTNHMGDPKLHLTVKQELAIKQTSHNTINDMASKDQIDIFFYFI